MGENEGEITAGGPEEKESTPSQDSLQVPAQKKKKLKSPTPSSLRGRSATPIRGRSQTPFNLYMTRRSATPSTWRSITPFLKREEKEKTPFELGRDLKSQITCNIAVFDRALIMDISEPEELQKPVRYITSDMSVIDRAAVMDVSNVEVIYVVEEYEEYEEEEEIIEEVKPKKKEKKPRKGRTPRKSMESDVSLGSSADGDFDGSEFMDREDSVDLDDDVEESDKKKPKKKAAPKKKKEEKKEKSPSPKLSLKLEIGGGQKGAKKLFEQAGAGPKPPPKKSKLAIQMEEQAKAAAKAAEEEAARAKPKGETFEEKQKRLQAEKEEEERLEAEARAQEEEEAAEEPEEAEEGYEPEDGSYQPTEMGEEEVIDEYKEEAEEASELADEVAELPEKRRGSDSSDDFIRPDPYDEERWKRIAAEDGEEFMQHLRKYSLAQRRSEKERDADWQKKREQVRLPHFINFLTDRTAEAGQSVRLACAVGGPDLSVKWFKDKRQLERDGTHRIINNNNILALEVLNTTILDSGEYSCIVANSNDEVTSSCIVTIYEVFKDEPKPPSFRFIKDYYHLRDDELTIEVHIYGVPRPVVTWWRGVFEVKPSYKYTKLEEAHGVYKLLIYKPTSKDNGIYVCKAINSQGEAQIAHTVEVTKNRHFHARGIFHARDRLQRDKELTARKAMEEALKSKAASDLKRAEEEPKMRAARASPEPLVPVKQKLSFATQLRDRMALEGTNVRFVCTVIGPQPSCRWMKDDKWVVVGPNIRNLSEEGKAILELVKVSTEASGVYKCVAKNDVSEIETSCYFKVYSAQTDGDEQEPIFALPLRDVYHSSQNDLIIDTKVRGNPRPVITWIKDDLPVVLDDRIVQIEHLDGVCELIINKPTTNDNGVYCCICENKLGSQKITHTVVIEPIHISRRSSVLSGVMSETDNTGTTKPKGEAVLPPKAKQDEGESSGYERRSRLPDVTPKQQLYFVANLSNRYVAEGSKVKLQAVIGGPDPIIKWMKDDQNVTYGPKIRNMNRDSLAVLEFLNALPEDSGKYTCMAQNEFCKISSTAELHVYQSKLNQDEPPVFVRPIKDTYHLTSNELILETGIRGQPTPEIQWFKDSIEIQNGGKYTIFQTPDGNCELIIDYPDHKDSGKYLIKAENRAGKVEIVHNVLFKGKDSHIADNIHGVYHADKSLLRPKKVEEEKPVPAPQEKPPKPDESADAAEESGKHKRGRRNTKKGDEEEEGYVSSATDYASDTGSMKKREKVIGIHFATSVRDRVVAEGSKVRISCFLEAKEPQVKWFKNDEPIVNGPKIRGRYSEGLCLLEINNATTEDSGEYRCWGRDETGEASSSCTLEVFADPGTGDVPPTFTRNIKDTLHGKLNELQLDVHVRGLPTPTVTWVKDGVKIEPNEKYQVIEHDDGTCELFVNNPNPQDSGKYVCQAENREGKTEIVHNVTVEARHRRVSPSREGRPPSKPAGENETGDAQLEGEPSKARKKSKTDEEETGGSRREVPPPPDLRKQLYFRNFLSNRTVKSGSNVKWMVNIDGPEPTARWFHGDQPIAFGPKSKMSCQDGIAWLNLVGVTEEDSGEYTLKVRGPENEIVSTCNLFVYSLGVEEKVAPVFTSGIKEIFQSQSNELILECQVTGDPKPLIYWHKDHKLLSENERIKCRELDDGVIQLVLTNPTFENSGFYECHAKNELGLLQTSKYIDVSDYVRDSTCKLTYEGEERNMLVKSEKNLKDTKLKLSVESVPKNIQITKGSKARLTFHINGLLDEVDWFKYGDRIIKDKRHKILNINGTVSLEISEVNPDDSGIYKCVVKNSRDSIETSCNLTVYNSDDEIGSDNFVLPLLNTYSLNENELVLDCRVRGKPKPEISWMKGMDLIVNDKKYQQYNEADGYSKLIISSPNVQDSGVYTCVARNEVSENKMTHQVDFKGREHFTLEKTHGFFHRDPNKPHFLAPLGNQTVCPGGTVAITAEFMQSQTPIEVNWMRDRKSVHGQPNVKTFYDRGSYTLAIMNAGPETEGTYTCRASNAFGRIESHATVDVAVGAEKEDRPPLFLSRPDNEMKIALGDPFSISFRIAGDPKPKLTFMKGTKDITKSDRVSKEVSDDYTRFTVQKSQISDSGTYFVVARNNNGTDRIFVTVTVYPRARSETPSLTRWGQPLDTFPEFTYFRDPPGPISTEPLLIDSGESHLSLSWGKPYMENAAPVTGYRVDVWVVGPEGGAFWKELGLTPINSFDVLNLKPNVEYHFRVTPKNRYGWGPSVQTKYPLQLGGGDTLPVFVSPLPAQLKALKDDQIKLECAVHGAPQPHITWYKDSLPLKCNSDRVTIGKIASKCILTLTKVCESDTGRYTCEASNCKGRSSTFTRLQVVTDQRLFEADTKLKQIVNGRTTSSEIDCLPLFTKRLRDRRAQVSHPVRFTCQILGYPRPVVTWYKNDNILGETDRYHMAEDGQFYTLEIASTTLDDGGIYTCRAQNIQGSISCHCSLVVDKGIRTYIPPEFIVPLEPVYIVKERQDIRLTARVEAYPSVAVSWNFNGIKLRQSRRILVTLDQYGVVELLIKNATLHDEGSYECTASNAVGKIENCCRVQVEPNEDYHKINACKPSEHYSKEPLFVVKPRSSEAFEGDTVIIFCEVVGDPKPEVVWLRDFLKPEYYKDAPHFQRIGDGPEYRLEIPDAKLDFTGSYSVIAKNIHGEAKAVISLQIYVKNTLNNSSLEKGTIRLGNVETLPHFVRHLKDIRCCDGDSIVLECQVEAIPEPIVIWEKDGHVICNDKEFVMFYDGVKATLSILRVFPEDEGVYTCVARNILGRSVSVACVIVDMPEEKEAMLNRRMLTPSDLYSSSTNLRSSSSDLFSHGAASHSYISRGKFHATRFDTIHRAFRGPKFLSIPQNRVVEEGESVRFQCTVSENPPTWCTWDKDGGILTPTTRIKIREVNDSRILDIENITFEDAGLYRITLKNDYGRIETTARLDVICNSRYSKSSTTTAQRISYINKRIMSPSMTMGERLALAKGYRGSSLPPIKYAHNGNYVHMTNVCFVEWHKRIIYNEKRLINFSNDLPYINQCMENSQFKNELILFKNMIMLILILNRVLDELEFWYLSHPQNTKKKTLSLIIEQHNNITAIFLGYPKFQGVRKLLQSQPMKNTNNVSVHKKDSSSSLTIRKIPADDIGKYTVESMNKWNMDSTKISVAVEGPPDPPSGKPNISLGPDHISIAWSAPPNDGGSMITGFIIEVESSEKWQELARVVDCLEYTMKSVNLNTSYRFRIIAENTHGKSAPGLPSDFVHMCLIDSKKDISSNARANGNFKSRFEILEEIGKGRFGTVFKVQDKEEPYEILAAKVIKCIKSRDHQKVREEISIMQSLNHPKLLRLEAFYETPRDITMVMEYITGGELFERVVADDFSLTELDCRLFIRQLCEGVAYMHDNFIVHLDLKPENIMCQTRETHDIKIIDFGLAQRIHTDAPVRVMFGTPEFISPEVINYEPIGLQSDMWSIGVVSYVLLSGLSPFMGDSDVDTFTNIIRADYDFDDDAFDDVSQEAKDFISNLLVHKKDDRLTAHQCLESKWLNVQNQSETLSNNKICTDKLKKFIIRRKWQKTGNAIRALGRMANLSASRRNSAILNSSMPNSPRPSISGLYIPYEMTCLHKEEDLETLEPKENCKEHSHSDYSDTALEGLKCKKIESPTILSNAVSHDYLKSKLEDIAQQVNSETEVLKSEKIVTYKDKSQGNFSTKVVPKAVKNKTWFRTLSSSSTKELIMPSDFTNTVKMRKRTLERNISRDRFRVSKPSIETTSKGKVSFLKSKFNESPKSLLSLTNPPDANTNFNLLPRTKDSTDATASHNLAALKHNSGNNEKSCCDSTANKPSSTRLQSPTTKRISDKVREVTDRLSQQTISSSARERENSELRQSRKIHNAYRLNKTL